MSIGRIGNHIGGKAAIVGIGATEFSKDSGRSEMSLASEAVAAARPKVTASTTAELGLSTIMSTFSTSYHWRATFEPTSALFW